MSQYQIFMTSTFENENNFTSLITLKQLLQEYMQKVVMMNICQLKVPGFIKQAGDCSGGDMGPSFLSAQDCVNQCLSRADCKMFVYGFYIGRYRCWPKYATCNSIGLREAVPDLVLFVYIKGNPNLALRKVYRLYMKCSTSNYKLYL